jgi:CDP-diglyceride synthetase
MTLPEIFISVLILIIVCFAIYEFFTLTREKQLDKVRHWLLFAVVEAEKALGSKTGQIKLRYVYDMFITKFKYLSLIITFEQFSLLVDEALDTMKGMLQSNTALLEYIKKDKEI